MEQRRVQATTWVRTVLVLVVAMTIAAGSVLAVGVGDARAQDSASVSIVDFAFEPGAITVDVGTTVTWTNNGNAPHTVTADDGSFDSGTIDSGGAYSFTFDTPGTYSYFCAIHPNMVATVVVTGDEGGGDDGDDAPPTTVPDTGVGPASMHDSTSLLLGLAMSATALIGVAIRQRRVA